MTETNTGADRFAQVKDRISDHKDKKMKSPSMRSRKIIIKEKEENLRDLRDTMEHNYTPKIQIPK